MKKILDNIQEKILSFIKEHENSDGNFTLQYLWDLVWLDHPQKVVNKLEQLEKKWFIQKINWTYKVIKNISNDIYYIPIFWAAQCGIKWPEIVEEYPKEYLPYPIKDLKNPNDKLIAVKARWRSMEPEINSWDLVIVRMQDYFDQSNTVLISHNNEAKIKKIIKKGNEYYLHSLNNNFEDVSIVDENEIKIIWIVVQINKKYE